MSTFRLGTFDLDANGTVAQGGKWTTTPDNRILVVPAGGSQQTFDAAWRFNGNNQLVLQSGGADLFNFGADTSVTPRFETRNSVLRVTPNILNPFSFELRGEWGLTANHDLEFTPLGGALSTIVGFINSPEGKFIFFFADKARPLLKQKLGFAGVWRSSTAGEGQLAFDFRREDGSIDTFELPGKVSVNKTTNQLRYEYQKGGVQAIDFEGTLIVSEDLTISYHLLRRTSSTGEVVSGETTLSFGAVYQKNNFSGELELTLTKADGSASTTTLTIAGNFVGVLGKTNVAVGFAFSQVREGQTVKTTFALAGRVEFAAGQVVFSLKATGGATRQIALDVGAQIRLGPAGVDARLHVDLGAGGIQSVTFLLGVSF
ncbi:MAG TPA: hypothetical protein VKE96_18860 [Vicinamibacterales bacterium]|nr:hypothetical protein [Vicinamibacterales bacterium]